MLEKIYNLLNIISGSSIGVFIGHTMYECWHYKKYSDLYAMQSAPCYAGILVYGVFTVVVLMFIIALKHIIRLKLRNSGI